MSWIEKLYRTYENNTAHIGEQDATVPLLPICHTTQNAQVHIILDGDGNFLSAESIPKTAACTIIPATEKSAGRTSGPIPHPLCDKLQYIAADYPQYGGTKPALFTEYCQQLAKWCASPFSDRKVRAVLTYIRKGEVIRDVIQAGVFHLDEKGKLLEKWPGISQEAPDIFRVLQGENGQLDAFVRFSVEIPGDPQAALWLDAQVWQSWEKYNSELKAEKGLCYVSGVEMALADQHPAKIRNSGDKAKLISSNDTSGFTFLGRFTSADEACGVSFSVTQKAHSALRWLIARQGWRDGDQAIVAWAVSGAVVPSVLWDTATLLSEIDKEPSMADSSDTAQNIGVRLAKRLSGYSATLGPTDEVVVMGVDSATPGRMAIRFYRELTGSELLARVQAWHTGCCWPQRLSQQKIFIGAPAPRDIAEAAYGRRLDDQLRKATVERLLPCIVDGAALPVDLVECCVRRACNKQGMEAWEWEKTLGIACALYRYQQLTERRTYSMALERDRTTRDYLYGRLLALAEQLEQRALRMAKEQRDTNAGKLLQRFAERPFSTWLTIETALTPYKQRLRSREYTAGFLRFIETEIDDVAAAFTADEFTSDKRLSGEFLLGYHCQRAALRYKADDNDLDNPIASGENSNETLSEGVPA